MPRASAETVELIEVSSFSMQNPSGMENRLTPCAVGNERAARFYEKCGWQHARTVTYQPDAADGAPPLEVWAYEKRLR